MKRPDPITAGLLSGTFMVLCLIPFLSVPLGYALRAGQPIGWTACFAIFTSVMLTLTIRGSSKVDMPVSARWLLAGVLAFSAYAVAGLFSGPNDFVLAGVGVIAILGGYGAGLGAYVLAKTGNDPLPRFLRWLVIGAIPLAVLPLLVAMTVGEVPRREWLMRLYGIGNPRALGHYTTVVILVLMGLSAGALSLRREARGWVRLGLQFVVLTVMWSLLLWSGSRGGVLAVVLGFAVASLVLWRLQLVELLFNAAAAASGAALSLLYVVPHGSFSVLTRAGKLRDAVEQGASAGVAAAANGLTSGRTELWAWSVEKIMQKPFLGWGFLPISALRREDPAHTPHLDHAHNLLLDYAMGFGIPVALAVTCIVIWLWFLAARGARRNPAPEQLAAFYLVTALPIYSMISLVLGQPFQMTVFGLCLGALIGGAAWRRRDLSLEQEDLTLGAPGSSNEALALADIE